LPFFEEGKPMPDQHRHCHCDRDADEVRQKIIVGDVMAGHKVVRKLDRCRLLQTPAVPLWLWERPLGGVSHAGHICFGRQTADDFAGFRFCGGKFELRLEIEPELRIDSEPVTKPKRGIAGDGALAGDDLADAIGRHSNLAREFCRAHAECIELVP
jgi:hypothetical protein